ncbi:MAG: helix-turn-helix transcriptional regulator [Rhizobiales bacterium]|nr:helix-turn-helix transcriptional regulator [Hyphomicrobiales bacterium]
MAFKEALKRSRIKKGYSLQELANLIGVSKAHIWDLEQGRAKNPSLEILEKLSTHLNVPISTLVEENPEENENNDESVVMYRDLQKLDDEDRETIRLMMDRLKKRTENRED